MNLWKHVKALKPNTWDVIFSSKSKCYKDVKEYLKSKETCLFSVVPFIYAWKFAHNEQSNKQNKQMQDIQYISNLWKTRVRSESLIFKGDNN